ncbi:plasma membrane-type proton ATPase [Dorcoceras hygrometricum]|uniref:Plasma membrane-type proton ATPase n=1 Tax=Dorcoceras hygrometricum TaxID=472368 RepID=A0A2Z7BI65_9LAMI|nr:plasma membrane-type proton ATPase [Dorcoceras hygrometricum]
MRRESLVTVEEAVVSYYSRSCRQLPFILLLTNLLAVAILITVNESVSSRDSNYFAILITVDESVDSRYSRRLLMSNVEQEADTNKRNSEESDVVLKIQQMLFALITSSRKIPAGSYIKSQAFETNEWTTSCKHIVTTNWTTSCKYIQTQATAHPYESCCYASSRKMMYQSQALCIQSQDDVPVASYSGSSRELQCYCVSSRHVDMVSRRNKSRSSEALQPGAKYSVVKVTSRSDEPAAKQLTIYEELSKLDVNC